MDKKITPLSKFPTEAILMNFRKKRMCYTNLPWYIEDHYNHGEQRWEYWQVILGPFEIDGIMYEDMPIGYTKIASTSKEREKINNKYTTTTSSNRFDDEMWFNFDGIYWRGKISEIKEELAKRPHVPLKGGKDFRRWKQNYKKSLKK